MQLQLTPEQELFRSTTAKFLERESSTAALRVLAETPDGFSRDWWRQAAELGWTSLLVPEERGGGSASGAPLEDAAIVAEEAGRSAAPGPLAVTSAVLVALTQAANAGRHAAELEAIVAGDAIATWASYEPGHGWDPRHPTLEATACEGGFRLRGVKDRVEAGDQADLFLVTAHCSGTPMQLLVRADSHGLHRERMWSLDFTRRFARVTFNDVFVPAACVIGDDAHVAESVERQCQTLWVLQSAETLGATDRVFAMTLQWAFDRYTFGRALASYQALKHRFARMKMLLEAMHATTGEAARAVQNRTGDVMRLARIANFFVSTRALEIMQDCVQMHGGIGVTWEHDLHLYLRRATVNRAFYGSPAELRVSLAALIVEESLA